MTDEYKEAQSRLKALGIDVPDLGIPSPYVDFLSTVNSEGKENIIPCQENVTRAIRSMRSVRFDSFKQKYEIKRSESWEAREDYHDMELHSQMSVSFPFLAKQGIGAVCDAITLVGSENTYDSAQDYVTALTWDEVPRLDTWLHNTYHVDDNAYHTAIGANWWKGMVKRIMYPGCKFDYALLLQGAQGVKKSTSLLTISGQKYHTEFTDLKVKDFQQDIQGKFIVEFSEGAVFTKSDQESLKSIITRQQDTYRPPYAKASRDFPRRCVFAVTANNDEILKDETGNRRWWVVVMPDKEADIDWLEENRDQLFAEAYHRLMNLKESTWEVPTDALIEQQESVRMREQNEDIFTKWYNNLYGETKNAGVTVRQAYCGVFDPRNKEGEMINPDTINIDKKTEMTIARTFKHMGLIKTRTQAEGRRTQVWVPKTPYDNGEIPF